ncbi:MAG: HAD hydrolase family protein, partial [Ruminiclostridium sp.]|nr:HAD hydrolase family protein [Ruminiclostridium sp.]
FSDVDFYKFTKKGATKEKAAQIAAKSLGIAPEEVIAFGDDMVDLEMLRLCGCGVAMDNAIGAVKEIADAVTESNDRDGVAKYLEEMLLTEKSGV